MYSPMDEASLPTESPSPHGRRSSLRALRPPRGEGLRAPRGNAGGASRAGGWRQLWSSGGLRALLAARRAPPSCRGEPDRLPEPAGLRRRRRGGLRPAPRGEEYSAYATLPSLSAATIGENSPWSAATERLYSACSLRCGTGLRASHKDFSSAGFSSAWEEVARARLVHLVLKFVMEVDIELLGSELLGRERCGEAVNCAPQGVSKKQGAAGHCSRWLGRRLL